MRPWLLYLLVLCLPASCIEPPLHLASAEALDPDLPVVNTELEVQWNLSVDWNTEWHYGWTADDESRWGPVAYPEPTGFEVRRYYLGDDPHTPVSRAAVDGFHVQGTHFRRNYRYGYYHLLVWSDIDSPDGTQVLIVDDAKADSVYATTTVTRGLLRADEERTVTALYNQPEVFYASWVDQVYISRDEKDYDYYDEDNRLWVKHIKANLTPRVYIYLVQALLHHNDGRIVGVSGDAAVSALANSTNVRTGHTGNTPCMVYYGAGYRADVKLPSGEQVDVAGGKLTTFGLCDQPPYAAGRDTHYTGSRGDLNNYVYLTLRFRNGTEKTVTASVTEQCQAQCYGGVLTVHFDCREIEMPPDGSGGPGNLFVPTVEDYENVDYEIPM